LEVYFFKKMVRSGFWKGEMPTLPKELEEKEKRLKKSLNELATKVEDPQKALKLIHKERMARALKKREETRPKKSWKTQSKGISQKDEKTGIEWGLWV